jgi:hypothetical protein
MSVFDVGKLETVLQAHWTEFLDTVQVMRVVLQHVRDTSYRVIKQEEIPPRQTKITVTKFSIKVAEAKFDWPETARMEIWAEFTVPKGDGVVVGTVIADIFWSGELYIKESFGTEFQLQTP